MKSSESNPALNPDLAHKAAPVRLAPRWPSGKAGVELNHLGVLHTDEVTG